MGKRKLEAGSDLLIVSLGSVAERSLIGPASILIRGTRNPRHTKLVVFIVCLLHSCRASNPTREALLTQHARSSYAIILISLDRLTS